MKLVEKYLKKIQSEFGFGYNNPLQTRPKSNHGIVKNKTVIYPPGVKGPSGYEVDLDQEEENPDEKSFSYTYKNVDK